MIIQHVYRSRRHLRPLTQAEAAVLHSNPRFEDAAFDEQIQQTSDSFDFHSSILSVFRVLLFCRLRRRQWDVPCLSWRHPRA